jgi:hypothetical protein
MRGSLPDWLRFSWYCFLPLGLPFAARIAWEETVWTMARGPQMVGFSLMHIHPLFFITGTLSAYLIVAWLVPAGTYAVVRRKNVSGMDLAMILIALFVAITIIIPDDLFAVSRR